MAHIALVYSDTGGGHRTAAEAIQRALVSVAGATHTVALTNGIACLPFPFNHSEAAYSATMRRAPWLHRLGYHALNGDRRRRVLGACEMALDGRRAIAFVRQTGADLYVACQPHFNPFLPRAVRATAPDARYVHVVTDLCTVHAFHFPPEADLIIVPTAEVRAQAIQHGLGADRVVVAGYPIAPDFMARLVDAPAARQALGLARELPMLLMMGGGDGMGALYATAAALMRSALRAQLIVVCGRNAALKSALDALVPTVPTRVLGFIDNVPALMGASTMLITKAGTASVCEALAAGLPILLYDAVPGQEDGNRDYLVDHGAAVFRPSPAGVLAQAAAWLHDAGALAQAREAAARLARPDAAVMTARAILALLDGRARDNQDLARGQVDLVA